MCKYRCMYSKYLNMILDPKTDFIVDDESNKEVFYISLLIVNQHNLNTFCFFFCFRLFPPSAKIPLSSCLQLLPAAPPTRSHSSISSGHAD